MTHESVGTLDDTLPAVQDPRIERFLGALAFLRQTHVPQTQTKLFDLPWFLMIGSTSSGKSSLLAESGLDFLLRKKNPKMTERFCDWWATSTAVWLDVNAEYALYSPEQTAAAQGWHLFLDHLSQAQKQPLGGVVFVIHLHDLLLPQKDAQLTIFDRLAARLYELGQRTKGVAPVYIAITHCNALLGFVEYFDDLNAVEREQPWGLRFTHTQQSKQRLADSFELEFSDMLQRLHARVIMRLQQERKLESRALIKDFPLQMESIKKPIAVLLQALVSAANETQKFIIRGLYWSAFAQTLPVQDRLMQPLGQRFDLQPYASTSTRSIYENYFIGEFFTKGLLQDSQAFQYYRQQINQKHSQWWFYGIIAASSLLVLTTVFGGMHRFISDLRMLNQAEAAISAYQTLHAQKADMNLKAWLPALNQLETANQLLKSTPLPWLLRHIGNHRNIAFYADSAYQAALRDMLASTLSYELNHELTSPNINLASLYGNLKIYLMLGEPKHYQANYVMNWILSHWQEQENLTPTQLQSLSQHLNSALKNFNQPLTLNADLIAKARARLIRAQIPELTLALLANNTQTPLAPVILTPNVPQITALFSVSNQQLLVSGIYSSAAFANIYDKVIPQVAQTLSQGDWVLGEHSAIGPVSNDLLQVIRNFYLEAYQQAWDKALNHIKLTTLVNYASASYALEQFAAPSPELKQFFKTIADNTNVTYGRMPTPISQHFAPLNAALKSLGHSGHDSFVTLATTLNNLGRANNRFIAALAAAKAHAILPGYGDALYNLNQLAATAPAPLNQWLDSLQQQSWQLVLNDASQTINVAWQATVIPVFNRYLAGKYPIAANSQDDADPNDFANFFGTSGTLDNFYQHYLLNLVDLRDGQVIPRSFGGAQLALSPQAWQTLSRITIIHQGWFSDPKAPFNLNFSLTGTTIPNAINAIDVSIGDQRVSFAPNYQTSLPVHWRGNENIAISLSGEGNTTFAQHYQGFWALYRWLDTAVAVETQDLNTLQASFVVGPWQMTYTLKSNPNTPMPLAPEVIHGLAIASPLL